jgi:serine protease DegS
MRFARAFCLFLLLAAPHERALAQEKGWLGLIVSNGAALHFGPAPAKKTVTPDEARVLGVVPEGPAAAGGVRLDDVVLALDGEPFKNSKELADRLKVKEPGSIVFLRVKRGDESVDVRVVLGTRPPFGRPGPGERPINRVPVP